MTASRRGEPCGIGGVAHTIGHCDYYHEDVELLELRATRDEEEQRQQAEAALADALSDDRMDSLPDLDVLNVAQAVLRWLAEDGWELRRP